MAKSKNFSKFQQALFTRSAKMMSYELRTRRDDWEMEHEYVTRKAKHQHRKIYRRTCNYCMHSCYQELLVELQAYLRS
ncbi:MAG: hypothetical protein MJZ75_04190 [Paludibacteraceae bacterium]|nr:hypothetical protein [Paludibacteraceae bacterium]